MKVFISYAQADHRLIHVLSSALTEAGIVPLIAVQRPSPGKRIEEKVRDMIADSDCVIVLNTVQGAKSRWVQQEIGCAKALGKDIIPLKTRSATFSAMLEGYEFCTFSPSDPYQDFVRVAGYLREYAERKRLPLLKGREVPSDEAIILHLPHAMVCPRCKNTDVHVFLCLLCGDWVCTECGETIPQTERAAEAVRRKPKTSSEERKVRTIRGS